jgi:hypothetical protein
LRRRRVEARKAGEGAAVTDVGDNIAVEIQDRASGINHRLDVKAGITKDNTLFIITADENDHFVGGPPSPSNCDGIKIAYLCVTCADAAWRASQSSYSVRFQ